ncbi:Cro/Cl family transcriptional regulator [Escherichia coli]|nr:Cro/Cl family transcriptional regulator [Escherichia coli]KXK84758.1 Cro/Cl family transcriptional regulator [Escherichia coli]KYS04392.1 Cro/Cl family transcriptional regulator [Escherichia coli]KYT38200.1 Cro/Cl family transcriptional regulator [Escherichia coli]KYV71723.1 Cro/Cl family transcriptional regulator [Escherichia coli]
MPGGYLDMEPEDTTESPSSRTMALTPNQLELLQIFSAFPDAEQQEIIKELRNKKEAMEDLVARWLARQGRRA